MSKEQTTETKTEEKRKEERLSKRVERVGGFWKLLDDGNYVITISHSKFPNKVIRGKWLTELGKLAKGDFMSRLGALETTLCWRGYGPNSVTIKKDKLVSCGNPVCNKKFKRKNKKHVYCQDFCRGMMAVIKKRRSNPKS